MGIEASVPFKSPASPGKRATHTPHVLIKSLALNEDSLYSVNIKCALLGCSGVGKTSFKSRFLWDEYKDGEDPTMGAVRHVTSQTLGRICLKIDLWDTGSVERYQSFVPIYLKDCACVIILFDITDKDTFLKSVNLSKSVKNNCPEGTVVMLVGNKVDMESRREVKTEEALEMCNQISVSFCEMSCKANFNIRKPLQQLVEVIEKMIQETAPPVAPVPKLDSPKRVIDDVDKLFTYSPYAKKLNDEYIFACAERLSKTAQCAPVELTLTRSQLIFENIQTQKDSSFSLLAPVEGLFRFLSRREYDLAEENLQMRISRDSKHAQRMEVWVRRRINGAALDLYLGDEGDEYLEESFTMLCPLRDLLFKCFKERLPTSVIYDIDSKSSQRPDFLKTYRDHCKCLKITSLPGIEDQIAPGSREPFDELFLGKGLLRDAKQLTAILEGMRWNASVSSLILSSNNFGIGGILPLCRVAHVLHYLTCIDLSDNRLGREGGVFVAGLLASMPNLRRLVVDHNNLADGAACIGATLAANNSLASLSLSGNHIGSDTVLAFSRAFVLNTTLMSVDFSNNDITEEAGLPLLNALSCNSTITHLSVIGNRDLSQQTIAALTLPKNSFEQEIGSGHAGVVGKDYTDPYNDDNLESSPEPG